MKRFTVLILSFMVGSVFGGLLPNSLPETEYLSEHFSGSALEQLKMEKRFGVGFSAAGPLSMLGLEIDVNMTEDFSMSAGWGTGFDYSTFMVKGRYFLLGKWISPYFAGGFARWWGGKGTEKNVKPSVLANRFIGPEEDASQGFNVFMFYPAFGVQFMHPLGLAFFVEVQYLFKLFNFAHGTYAGLGIHWYL